MINFPEPAKPVLHLPYLEDPGFTSNQPQEWQPGDLLSHSEALHNILGSTNPYWIRRIPIKSNDQAGLHQLAKPTSFKESLQPIQLGSTQRYLWEPGDTIDHSEDIQDVLSCTSTQEIRRISLSINIPYMATITLNALEEFLQIFAQDQRPYYLLLRRRSISGRLEDHGHVQKLSRYKIIQVILLKAQIELTAKSSKELCDENLESAKKEEVSRATKAAHDKKKIVKKTHPPPLDKIPQTLTLHLMWPSDQQLNQRSTQSPTQPARAPTRTYVH
ncbi:hypothetical protein F2Q69_00015838 [Brassica cretica]|uniref:Uncharacterized protein n=1 Tax=Brassica cretica TaxID=69181 RepID=A0A8S9QTT3_BRACR|nr:hypothetical protein F2Q69_00015838 [Brassica cretica]